MNTAQILVLCVIFVPLAGALLLPSLGHVSEKLRDITAVLSVLVSVAGSAVLLLASQKMSEPVAAVSLAGSVWFLADRLAIFMAFVSSFVGSIIVIYSSGYISHYEHRNEYFLMVVLFLGAMMGLVFSHNLILIYLFWEITAFVCWRLIGFYRGRGEVVCADKAFLVTMGGALFMLLGFVMIYGETGSFEISAIRSALGGKALSNTAVILILLGMLSKSATVPFHTWLPDAGVAPSPVTALLHAAVLVKIGLFVYARLFVASFPIEEHWHTIVPVVAALSTLISGGAALTENNIKRIIAFSTVSQIGFIFLGLSIGNRIGVGGGLLYILMHGIAKAGLFLCAGIVEQKTHEKDIRNMGGLMETMPLTALSFLFCAFSVMGIPPTGGFFSKYLVFSGAVSAGHLWTACAFLAGAVLTMLYLIRLFSLVFMGSYRGAGSAPREGSVIMIASVVTLGLLSLASGIFVSVPLNFVESAVEQMMGAPL